MKYYVIRFNQRTDGTEKIGQLMSYDNRTKALNKLYRNIVEDMDNKDYVSGKVVMFNETMYAEKIEEWEKEVAPQTEEA